MHDTQKDIRVYEKKKPKCLKWSRFQISTFCAVRIKICYLWSQDTWRCSEFVKRRVCKDKRESCKTVVKIFDPDHDKTSEITHPPSLIRVFAVRLKKVWVLSSPKSAQRRLIRLGGCPGWSESSLGAYVILLVLSYSGSNIIRCPSRSIAHTSIILINDLIVYRIYEKFDDLYGFKFKILSRKDPYKIDTTMG